MEDMKQKKDKKKHKKRGPKPCWEVTSDVIRKIEEMSGLMKQEEMWNYFGVCKDTWYDRKNKHPEMAEAIKRGKPKKKMFVASSLMNQIKNGNVAAMIFYLKTQGGWSEKKKVEISKPKSLPELPTSLGVDPIEAARIYQKLMGG